MKKRLLFIPILAFVTLTGCNDDKNQPLDEDMYSLGSGGTVVDYSKVQSAKNLLGSIKSAADKAVSSDNFGFHFVVDNVSLKTLEMNKEEYLNVGQEYNSISTSTMDIGFKGKFDATVNGLKSATKFSELGAHVGFSGVNASLKSESTHAFTGEHVPSDRKNSEESYDFTVTNCGADAWLKDSNVYLDISNQEIDKIGSVIINNMVEELPLVEGQSAFQYFLTNQLGLQSRKFFAGILGDELGLEFPLISQDIKTSITEADVNEFAYVIQAYAPFIKDILTVKTYADGSFGIGIDVTKEKVINVYKYIARVTAPTATDAQIEASIPQGLNDFEKLNLKVVILFNSDSSLKRIGVDSEIKVSSGDSTEVNTGGNHLNDINQDDFDLVVKSYFTCDYNEKISYPDFSTYADSHLVLPTTEEDN